MRCETRSKVSLLQKLLRNGSRFIRVLLGASYISYAGANPHEYRLMLGRLGRRPPITLGGSFDTAQSLPTRSARGHFYRKNGYALSSR